MKYKSLRFFTIAFAFSWIKGQWSFIQKEAKYAAAIYLYKCLSLWRPVLDMLNNPHCSLSAAFIGTNSLQEEDPVHSTLSIWCFFYTIWVVWIVKCRKISIFFKHSCSLNCGTSHSSQWILSVCWQVSTYACQIKFVYVLVITILFMMVITCQSKLLCE